MPEVEEDHTNDCELTHVWYEWVEGDPKHRQIIAVTMKDPDGNKHDLMTKELVIHKLKKGHPL